MNKNKLAPAKKIDAKLIAEDFKKYEDKTAKKIKEGKKVDIVTYSNSWNGENGSNTWN